MEKRSPNPGPQAPFDKFTTQHYGEIDLENVSPGEIFVEVRKLANLIVTDEVKAASPAWKLSKDERAQLFTLLQKITSSGQKS